MRLREILHRLHSHTITYSLSRDFYYVHCWEASHWLSVERHPYDGDDKLPERIKAQHLFSPGAAIVKFKDGRPAYWRETMSFRFWKVRSGDRVKVWLWRASEEAEMVKDYLTLYGR